MNNSMVYIYIYKCFFVVCFNQVAFQGTVVTIENFLAWKVKFDLDVAELKRKKLREEEQAGKPKLTGILSSFVTIVAHVVSTYSLIRRFPLSSLACRVYVKSIGISRFN